MAKHLGQVVEIVEKFYECEQVKREQDRRNRWIVENMMVCWLQVFGRFFFATPGENRPLPFLKTRLLFRCWKKSAAITAILHAPSSSFYTYPAFFVFGIRTIAHYSEDVGHVRHEMASVHIMGVFV